MKKFLFKLFWLAVIIIAFIVMAYLILKVFPQEVTSKFKEMYNVK